ncbi:membrane-associated protein, putative, partial [Bodo saltans]
CGVTLVVIVACRPYAMHFDTAQSTVMNVLASAVIVLSILAEDDAATVITMVQALWSLAMLLLPVTVAVLELFGQLEWRYDEKRSSEMSSEDRVNLGSSLGTMMRMKAKPTNALTPSLEAELNGAIEAERHKAAALLLSKGRGLHALRQWDGDVAYGRRPERVHEIEFEAYCADLQNWSEITSAVIERRARRHAPQGKNEMSQKSPLTPHERLQQALDGAHTNESSDDEATDEDVILCHRHMIQPPRSFSEVVMRLQTLITVAVRNNGNSTP